MTPLNSLLKNMKGEEKGALWKVYRDRVGIDKDIMGPERDIKSTFLTLQNQRRDP